MSKSNSVIDYLAIRSGCESCGGSSGLTKSHFVKDNSVAKTKRERYDYLNPKNYFTQCIACHMEFEQLNKNNRVKALAKIDPKYARRAKWLITL